MLSVQEHILACINGKLLSIPVSESRKIYTPLWTETSHQGWAQTLQSAHLHPQWLKSQASPELPWRDLKKGSSARASDRSLCIFSVHEHLSRADTQWNLTDYALERLHEDSAGPTDLWVKALKLLWWLNSSHGHERHRAWGGWWLFLSDLKTVVGSAWHNYWILFRICPFSMT